MDFAHLNLLAPLSEAMDAPGTGPEWLGWAGLALRRAQGWSSVSPRPFPLLEAWAGLPLLQNSCVLVVTKKWVGAGQARWCVQGLICWEWEGGPLSQSLLCLP
jgi:hypothetical protein